MNIRPEIKKLKKTIIETRRDIHKHPELSFQEKRTSKLVAKKLNSFGIEVIENIGKTGVVGKLQGGNSGKTIALRADMDALPIQETSDVSYKSIGLVVIDEQHRFGVFQRMAFTNKGKKPSLLVMSATPIPRTLSLAAYGDMEESQITEKPLGRKSTITKSLALSKENELANRLQQKINSKEKIYWVCPLIEESEESDLQAATERFKILNNKYKVPKIATPPRIELRI